MERSAHLGHTLARWVDLEPGTRYTMRLRIVDLVGAGEEKTRSTLVIGEHVLREAFEAQGGAPPTFHRHFVHEFRGDYGTPMDWVVPRLARLRLELFRGPKGPLPLDDAANMIPSPFVIEKLDDHHLTFELYYRTT